MKQLDVVIRVRLAKEEKEQIEQDIKKYNYDISKLVRDCLHCFLRNPNCSVRKKLEEEGGKYSWA